MRSISLCLISKNEEHNVARLAQSIKGCFDQVILVDTGSTDKTKEIASAQGFEVHDFKWVDDFSAARNECLKYVTSDFWMWMDLDDVLNDREKFITWKSSQMELADFHYAPYNYAFDNGKPVCTFLRERVLKTSRGFKFHDFIHEGVKDDAADAKPVSQSIVSSWCIDHLRTNDEMIQDRGRNLRLLEMRASNLSPRLRFYLGKELFDMGRMSESIYHLKEGVKHSDLKEHDRFLGLIHLCHALSRKQEFDETIQYALVALQAFPQRAEFFCIIGDAYVGLGQLTNAIPFYSAALGCKKLGVDATYKIDACYRDYPLTQLAKINYNNGNFKEALFYSSDLHSDEMKELRKVILNAQTITSPNSRINARKTDEIVFTTPPWPGPYPWDESIYKTKGLGGSETACIEMSAWIKRLTGRPVKIFQHRESEFVSESGVEYLPIKGVHEYFKDNKPHVHIAWRHATRLTEATSYVWSHDLVTQGLEHLDNFEKVIALSKFHRSFLRASFPNLTDEKFFVSRNGIDPNRFKDLNVQRDPFKIIWPNSPDRGLEHAIQILARLRHDMPVELHVFYGLDNLYKSNHPEMLKKADMLKSMMSQTWIHYHGNVDQKRLSHEFASSSVWLYPASFIETFCISGIEALSAGCYPIVRRIGALQDTLAVASDLGMCDLIDVLDWDEKAYDEFAALVRSAILEKKYSRVDVGSLDFSWQSVAKEWIEEMKL